MDYISFYKNIMNSGLVAVCNDFFFLKLLTIMWENHLIPPSMKIITFTHMSKLISFRTQQGGCNSMDMNILSAQNVSSIYMHKITPFEIIDLTHISF